jgi:SSS family solute:Na+ symporter
MMNSISTIFTMDLYRNFKSGKESETELVRTGRIASFSAIVIAMIVARPLLGNFSQAFQYIQEFTGFFTPGVCALFLLGFFWPRTTAVAALLTALGSAVFSITLKLAWPALPFIDRVGVVFLLCITVGVVVSQLQGAEKHPKAINYKDVDTSTTGGFNIAALAVLLMLVGLYATWW